MRQQIKRLDDNDGKSMSDADDTFTKATDSLIALYRSVERSTLDLPLVSFMPFLIFLWAVMKFMFFLYVGIFLIIPVNLVILIRNVFPGSSLLHVALAMARRSTHRTVHIHSAAINGRHESAL